MATVRDIQTDRDITVDNTRQYTDGLLLSYCSNRQCPWISIVWALGFSTVFPTLRDNNDSQTERDITVDNTQQYRARLLLSSYYHYHQYPYCPYTSINFVGVTMKGVTR